MNEKNVTLPKDPRLPNNAVVVEKVLTHENGVKILQTDITVDEETKRRKQSKHVTKILLAAARKRVEQAEAEVTRLLAIEAELSTS